MATLDSETQPMEKGRRTSLSILSLISSSTTQAKEKGKLMGLKNMWSGLRNKSKKSIRLVEEKSIVENPRTGFGFVILGGGHGGFAAKLL